MTICSICCFDTELDDVVIGSAAGRCVCLRCFGRETGTALPMPGRLRREIMVALAVTEPVDG